VVLNVYLAGYVPAPMNAPPAMPSDMPQSTVGQFGPVHLLLPLPGPLGVLAGPEGHLPSRGLRGLDRSSKL